jgi:hypothetical protein
MDEREFVAPAVIGEAQVDETRAGDGGLGHFIERAEFGGEQFGKRARVGARWFGKHHRGVGGDVAVRRVARRLDADRAAVEPGRQGIAGDKRIEGGADMVGETAEQGHGGS